MSFNKDVLTSGDDYDYVTRTSTNQGILQSTGFVNSENINEAGTWSLGLLQMDFFYRNKPWYAGQFVRKIIPKNPISRSGVLYFSALLNKLKPSLLSVLVRDVDAKFLSSKLLLPMKNNEIDFHFIENFITTLEAERIETLEAYLLVSGFKDCELTQEEEDALEVFDNQQWQEFRMGDLFDRVKTKKLPYKAKELPKEPQGEFSLPALTSSFMNQGLNYYVPKEGATVLQNVISIPSNSDVYRAYFQSQKFTVLSDAYAIDWIGSDKELRPNDYLFIVPSINKVTDLPIYSYKNKLGGWNVVKDKLIKLPVNEQGEINFDYMATLVQAIKKLAIKDVVLYADRQIEATKEVVQKGSK